MSNNQSKNKLQCPDCGSHNTQTIPLAHAQSVRVYDGGESISSFGKSIAPPARHSEVVIPSLLGATAGAFAYFVITFLALENNVRWLVDDGILGFRLLAPSGTVGLIVCIILINRAARHNKNVYGRLLRIWEQQLICRRCSHRFSRPGFDGARDLDE